jgi:hypothetical protein
MHKVIVQRKIKVGWEILLISLSVVFWPIAFIIYMAFTFINPDLRIKFFNSLKYSFRIFIFVVIPLLVIAGLIEGGLMGLLR